MTEEEYLNHLIQHASKQILIYSTGNAFAVDGLNENGWIFVTSEGEVEDLLSEKKIKDENLANASRAYVAMHKLSR